MADEEGAFGDHHPRVAELSQALARHLSGLQDAARPARLQALAGLRETVLAQRLPPPVLQEVFGKVLLRPLTRCLADDPAERCRELALELTRHGLSRGTRPAKALPFLMPALARRLCWPRADGEACEELRLGLLQLLGLLLEVCDADALAPYLPEVVCVLRSALLDPYPRAKREGCAAAAACAKAMPGAPGGARGGRAGEERDALAGAEPPRVPDDRGGGGGSRSDCRSGGRVDFGGTVDPG
ncbi:Dynein assembly factor 5, axonemal [Varanus komodoensis]|nr:Dynein assembly factor 5, axonemal [Varanus komodoensis]